MNTGIACYASRRFSVLPLTVALLLFTSPAIALPVAVTKVSLVADSFALGSWHAVVWEHSELDDTGSWNVLSPTMIHVPDAVRGRCSFQAGLQLGQPPNPGVWFLRITVNGGEVLGILPYLEAPQDPPGLRILTGYGPWFSIGDTEEVSINDFLEVEVFVQDTGQDPNTGLNIRSWFQCEWILAGIFLDGLESGNTDAWNDSSSS